MLVVSRHFHQDARAVLRDSPADRSLREISDVKGVCVCHGERAAEGFAFLERLQEGKLVGVPCQKK